MTSCACSKARCSNLKRCRREEWTGLSAAGAAESFMWPMVPVVHMIYRLWQLGRGSALVAVFKGPPHLQYILVWTVLSPQCRSDYPLHYSYI